MKRIENCEPGELVKPVMDGWYTDGGADRMWVSQEYRIDKFSKDPKERLFGPYSYVILRDGYGLDYILNYGRMVLHRAEEPPSLSDMAAMPQEFWVTGNGQYYENSRNRELFGALVKQAQAQGLKIAATRSNRVKSETRTYVFDLNRINQASITKQGTVCLSIVIEAGKSDGISENDLAALLRENGHRLNTKQDPWKIFNFYKKTYLAEGILTVEE